MIFLILRNYFIIVVLLMSCKKHSSLDSDELNSKNNPKNELLNKVFLFGSAIDSADFTIVADCDCCISHLAIPTDSTFIFVDYCVSGDNYSKGKYLVNGKDPILMFDSISIMTSYGFISDTSYEVTKLGPKSFKLQISCFKSKIVIISNDWGISDYGIEDGNFNTHQINEILNMDTIMRMLQLRIVQ